MPGSTCDCGRYRKVVGQLDVNIGRLKSSVKFVKNGKFILCFTSTNLYDFKYLSFRVQASETSN